VTVAVDADVDRSTLDRESAAMVEVVVIARDDHNHSAATQLSVRLEDQNDHGPVFRAALNYVGLIEENSPSFVVPVTVVVRYDYTNMML